MFLAFTETQHLFLIRGMSAAFAVAAAAMASLAFAALCLLAGPDVAPLGPRPSIPLVLLLSFGILAGMLVVAFNLLLPERRLAGYGLLCSSPASLSASPCAGHAPRAGDGAPCSPRGAPRGASA